MPHKHQSDKLHSQIAADIIALFNEFLHQEVPLFFRKVNGFRYWHTIRFSFILEIFNEKKWIERVAVRKQTTLIKQADILRKLLQNSIAHSMTGDRTNSDVLLSNSPNRVSKDGRIYDSHASAWLYDLPFSFTFWEAPLAWRHAQHGGVSNLFYLDNLLVRAQFHRYFMLRNRKSIEAEARYLQKFAQQFDVTLPVRTIYQMLTYVIAIDRSCKKIIRKQLLLKRPKLLIMLNHYDPLKMLITAEAKSLGIYVVEQQHGTMGKYHIAYNFEYSGHLEALPDEILTFGKFWNDTTRISSTGVKLTAVGWPNFEQQMQSLPKPGHLKKAKILFINQDTIGMQLVAFALKLSEVIDTSKFEILFKMHPREYDNWESRYPAILQTSKIKVLTKVDLYRYLAESEVHISVYSTTVIESLAFDKKLLLLDSYGVHFFSDLIESGRASLVRDSNDVLTAIATSQPSDSKMADVSYYWEPNSKEKLQHRVKEILATHV